MKRAKVSKYFKKSWQFDSLPSDYQERVIRFFSEDRHYMVDVSDVRAFLNTGEQFVPFETYGELAEYISKNTIKGLLACKKCNWLSLESFRNWGTQVSNLIEEDTLFLPLVHSLQFESDTLEEWYIASY